MVDVKVEEDVAEAKHEVLQNVASAIAESVMIGQVGAVATSKHEHAPDGCCLMEFASDPFPDEDGLKVKGLWLNGVQHARKWFQFSENEGTVNLMNMLHTFRRFFYKGNITKNLKNIRTGIG